MIDPVRSSFDAITIFTYLSSNDFASPPMNEISCCNAMSFHQQLKMLMNYLTHPISTYCLADTQTFHGDPYLLCKTVLYICRKLIQNEFSEAKSLI